MATIEAIKIRARLEIGQLNIKTPFVLSFNVKKSRGKISTFDASLKVKSEDISGPIVSETISIYAGEDGNLYNIFCGTVKRMNVSPCFDDPSYVVLNISGEDILSRLRGKKFTRRCRGTLACWAKIEGISRPGLRSGKFQNRKEPNLNVTADHVKSQFVTYASDITSRVDAATAAIANVGKGPGAPAPSLRITLQTTGE